MKAPKLALPISFEEAISDLLKVKPPTKVEKPPTPKRKPVQDRKKNVRKPE